MANRYFKYMPIKEYTYKTIKNEEVAYTHLDSLNDPCEGICSVKAISNLKDWDEKNLASGGLIPNLPKVVNNRFENQYCSILRNYYRVLCLTIDNKEPLMWAYYADGHKGICIEYDFGDTDEIKPIKYSDTVPPVNYNSDEELKKIIYCKSNCWKHEKEYRMLYRIKRKDCLERDIYGYPVLTEADERKYCCFRDNECKHYIIAPKTIIKPARIKKIFFGCRMENDEKKKIKEICSKDVELFQMNIERDAFIFKEERLCY